MTGSPAGHSQPTRQTFWLSLVSRRWKFLEGAWRHFWVKRFLSESERLSPSLRLEVLPGTRKARKEGLGGESDRGCQGPG